MDPLFIAFIVLCATFGGALVGMWLQNVLPEHHLDDDSRSTVSLATGLVATMSALVLGLVVASAKGTFDGENTTVQHDAAAIITLDRALAHYGPGTADIRAALEATVRERVAALWPEGGAPEAAIESSGNLAALEDIMDRIRALSPATDGQRWLQSRALALGSDLLETRWLVQDRYGASIPRPFLVILVCWLSLIFTSFGLFAPRHATVFGVLALCALSVSAAIFLILEMYQPFDGLIAVSSAPMAYALAHLGR